MEEGSIIRVVLPESDGKFRSRPALLLKRVLPHNDWLMCAISGRLHNEIKGLDILLKTTHPDFQQTHLKYDALIRTGFLYTLSEEIIEGVIGKVSIEIYQQVLTNLTKFISDKK